MTRYSVKFGVDRCPATKNQTNPLFCRNCDFKGSTKRDCCECSFHEVAKQESKHHQTLH